MKIARIVLAIANVIFASIAIEAISDQLPDTITARDGTPMVLISAGEFQMGSSDGWDDEKPVHTVYLDAFYMDKYEVTNAQYRKFVQSTGHSEPVGKGFVEGSNGEWIPGFRPWSDSRFNGDNQPVVCVNWEDAKAYAEWAGKRLPTEAEWEKAARGGLVGKRYPWGDSLPEQGIVNWADESARGIIPNYLILSGYYDGYVYTSPVGTFGPNEYDLCDMGGNILEWCMDWYNASYYTYSPENNPTGPSWGTYKVNRGGSWYHSTDMPVPFRDRHAPTYASSGIGFRCVQPDTIPPSAVIDLSAIMGTTASMMYLEWTAPGDDGNVGASSEYIVRYNTVPISESNWDESYDVGGEPSPKPAGSKESLTVMMPHPSAIYYFAIKSRDDVPLTSDISNSPHVKSNAIHLNAGWNLFSLHIQPSSTDPGTILSSIAGIYNSVWAYDPGEGWSIYAPGGVSDLNKLELGKGYWIKMDQPGTLIIDGIDPPPIWVSLEGEAWNLVGYSCRECMGAEECMSGIVDSINSVWEYNTVSGWSIYAPGGASDLEFMKPGYGYWIKANESCLWNVNQ